MPTEVKIIADSYSLNKERITTFVCRYPRYIHSETMTHRMFSRNASSSRAIPVKKIIDQVVNDPVIPRHWGKNQPGMQANEELEGPVKALVEAQWLSMRDQAVIHAERMMELGLHKQIANRILEPWQYITVIVTATEWDNFYSLRCHKDAHPDIQFLAESMLEAHNTSEPKLIREGQWHLPFVTEEERELYNEKSLLKMSVARCARVSYNNHDGTNPDIKKDIELHDKLLASGHMSPFEHQAKPAFGIPYISGNFVGWTQYRKTLMNENRTTFDRLIKKECR